tara:strand:+ start:1708 stop:2160 length:453 start_codon:yes stop_codon:yes gene_type:complete
MSFGYSVLGFGAHPSRGTPFAVSIITDGSAPLTDIVENAAPAGSGSFVTGTPPVPTFDISVVATGGSGSYTFAWTNSEVGGSDTFNVYSVNSTGTTNAAQYNTLALNGTMPANHTDPPHDVLYELSCRVTDGAGGDITVSRNLAFIAIGI